MQLWLISCLVVISILGVSANTSFRHLETLPKKLYIGYFPTWTSSNLVYGKIDLITKVPAYINVLNIAFMKPDCQYNGNLDITGTGLLFTSAGIVFKNSVAALKAKNLGTKILISIGGASYNNWAGFNEQAIANFIKDFGLDGVDLDFEPDSSSCSTVNGVFSCTNDAQFIDIVTRARKAVPSPLLLSVIGKHTGAYGYGAFENSLPKTSNGGTAVNLLKSPIAQSIDWINVMAYNAGTTYNSSEALLAYNSLLPGKIVIGAEVPPEAWGTHAISVSETTNLADFVNNNNGLGIMIWSIRKIPTGTPSDANPNAQMISDVVCPKFGLQNCGTPLFG